MRQTSEEEAVGTAMPKTLLLELSLALNPPVLVANCSFPAALAAPRAQQPLHCPLPEGAGPAVCAVTPLHQPGTEHLSAGAQSQGNGAGSMLCPQTSRAGTVVEHQNKLPCGTARGHLSWAPVLVLARVELIFFTAACTGLYFL